MITRIASGEKNKIKTKMASDSDEPDLGWAVGLPEMDLHRRAKKR